MSRRRSSLPKDRPNLASLVDDFERHGSDIAFIARRGLRTDQFTYREVASLSRRFAAEFVSRGIGKGDRVLFWAANGPEWVAGFFGCVLRGVLPVPIDVGSSPSFVQSVAREVSPKLLLTEEGKRSSILGGLPTILLPNSASTITRIEAGAIEGLNASDPLQIIFTSGTTGTPKGIVHTHANVLASITPIETELQKYLRYERLVHPLRQLHTLPLSHVFGQFMALWIPPLLGMQVVFEDNGIAASLLATLKKRRISALAAPPRILDLCRDELLRRFGTLETQLTAAENLSAWQRWWRFRKVHRLLGFKFWAFVCGGAALSTDTERFWNRLGFAVIQGYGMTETTALVTLNHPFRTVSGTIGQVLPGREVRIADDGEVLVRGATISQTAWSNGKPQASSSEWLQTGDLAEFDEKGNLRFRGRKKETIVTAAGLNIYPEDLEGVLRQQKGVHAAAVVEGRFPAGPEPVAVLVLAPHTSSETVLASANLQLAGFQQIRHSFLWPEPDLPRTTTGKVLKRELLARLEAGTPQENQETDFAELDSLGRVQFVAELEQRYGVTIDDSIAQTATSVEELQRWLTSKQQGTISEPTSDSTRSHTYYRWPWTWPCRFVRLLFLNGIAVPLLRLLAKPKLRLGDRDIGRRPMLFVANHVTAYDAAFVLATLGASRRSRLAVAMSGEMLLDLRDGHNQGSWFLNLLAPIGYWLITALFNVFPLPQRSGFRRSFEHMGDAVEAGYSVLVFPEGRRADTESSQAFRGGIGLLWRDLRVPAVPVRLVGLGTIKSEGGTWFRTGSISVHRGAPIEAASSDPEQLTRQLEAAVLRLE